MLQFYSNYKFQIYLLFFASIWLFILSFLLQLSAQNTIYPDSRDYFIAADNLFNYYRGHPNRPMVMAFITGLPFLFTQNQNVIFDFSFLVNLLAWFGSILLLFSILKNIVNQKTAFFITILFVLCVGNAMYIFHLLTESVFTLVLLALIYFLQKYHSSKNFVHLSIALSILIVSMLIKPTSKIIAVIVVLYFSRILISNIKNKAILLICFAFSLVLIQCAGMKYQFGNFTISYIDKITAYNYLFSKAKCIENGTEFSQINNPRADYIFTTKMIDRNEIVKTDIADQLKNNTLNVLKAYLSNLKGNVLVGNFLVFNAKNVLKTTYFDGSKRVLYLISFAQNLLLTLIGLLLSISVLLQHKKTNYFFMIIAFFIIYIVATSGISSDQGDRFHIIIYPMVLLLIAKYYQKLTKPFSEPLHK